jgi:hypothetical protein
MNRLLLGCGLLLIWVAAIRAQTPQISDNALPQVQSAALAEAEPLNVNSRYTVEDVQVVGWHVKKMSDSLRANIDRLKGEKLDRPKLEVIANEIKRELHVPKVDVTVVRGALMDEVQVTFEVPHTHEQDVELTVARFLYHSKQGWTAEGSATTHFAGNALTFGLVSDGDAMLERFAGVRAGIERGRIGSERVTLRFNFASYHNQWNLDTLTANADETYRTRQVFEPQATIELTSFLDLDLGTRFSLYRLAAPGAKAESSNAVVSTLRYHQRWGSDPSEDEEANASYNLTSATHVLASDPAYTRQTVNATYKIRRGRSTFDLAFLAGKITGVAPLFDRYVLGNASTLRGWNKYVLDPLGGSHVIHGSVNYAYRWFQAFYDTGAIWDRADQRSQKHSAGIGFKARNFQLAMAFPLVSHPEIPVFYAGMNF